MTKMPSPFSFFLRPETTDPASFSFCENQQAAVALRAAAASLETARNPSPSIDFLQLAGTMPYFFLCSPFPYSATPFFSDADREQILHPLRSSSLRPHKNSNWKPCCL
eukprot:TRINITY_DN14116_c1_g1_i3.p1 TRINITY_DN14116_c1_g1~~TRINITY_DN14116_c1_g1_i3.p1  ORF type:complete len:108 (+),score=13.55 TRINITY_DN14116_c1_g1_i3:57-380(+)